MNQKKAPFGLQINHSFVQKGIVYGEGRFVEGEIILIRDEIRTIRTEDTIRPISMKVVSIE
ncbi:MAG: hypothetical protein LUG18_09395 [Candidatus Azobacteroides sp.]|nr:hypothetical protein [Candidatus Azobacteroides sp.]